MTRGVEIEVGVGGAVVRSQSLFEVHGGVGVVVALDVDLVALGVETLAVC